MENSAALEIKTVIIGDSDVGKTSIAVRYCHNEFPDNATPTIGASFMQKRVEVDNVDLILQIWDTAGQERFRSMAPMYYRSSKAALLVFDVTEPASFEKIKGWRNDLVQHAEKDVVLFIVGNKVDKPNKFDLSVAEAYAESIGAEYCGTSALTGQGVQELFSRLARRVIDVYQRKLSKAPHSGANGGKKKDGKLSMNDERSNDGNCC